MIPRGLSQSMAACPPSQMCEQMSEQRMSLTSRWIMQPQTLTLLRPSLYPVCAASPKPTTPTGPRILQPCSALHRACCSSQAPNVVGWSDWQPEPHLPLQAQQTVHLQLVHKHVPASTTLADSDAQNASILSAQGDAGSQAGMVRSGLHNRAALVHQSYVTWRLRCSRWSFSSWRTTSSEMLVSTQQSAAASCRGTTSRQHLRRGAVSLVLKMSASGLRILNLRFR